MEKTGFIYIWFDKKRKMYYIGRHWGKEDDGYICSSNRMRDAYKGRPGDFKRRILYKTKNKEDLVNEEQRWLNMIIPQECGIKYYNKTLKSTTPSMRNSKHTEETKRKMSIAHIGKKKPKTEEHKRKLREIFNSQEYKEKRRNSMLGKKASIETRKKMSLARIGKPLTKEHIINASKARTGLKRSEESKKRMSDAHKGTKKPWAGGKTGHKDSQQSRENKRIAALIREEKKREERNNILNIMKI